MGWHTVFVFSLKSKPKICPKDTAKTNCPVELQEVWLSVDHRAGGYIPTSRPHAKVSLDTDLRLLSATVDTHAMTRGLGQEGHPACQVHWQILHIASFSTLATSLGMLSADIITTHYSKQFKKTWRNNVMSNHYMICIEIGIQFTNDSLTLTRWSTGYSLELVIHLQGTGLWSLPIEVIFILTSGLRTDHRDERELTISQCHWLPITKHLQSLLCELNKHCIHSLTSTSTLQYGRLGWRDFHARSPSRVELCIHNTYGWILCTRFMWHRW